ncbi:MAG: phosphate uptake regulator PhoU, partial [Prevotella sp.]
MIDLVKQRFFGSVITDFKVLSSVVLKQVDFTLALFELNNTPNVFEEIYNNERIIDSLDVKLRREMINTVALYNPR